MNTVDFARAIADETRQKIMTLCCCDEISVNDIVTRLGEVSQPTVSHHLKILRDAGLVIVHRRGKEIYYELNQVRVANNCCQLTDVFAPDVEQKML